MLRTFLATCLVLLLAACQGGLATLTADATDPAPDITSVRLHQDFKVRADFAGEYIQSGSITAFNSLNQYTTFCKLELRKPAPDVRVIHPDTFTVSRIYRDTEIAGFAREMYAGDGSSGLLLSRTVLYLASDRQPDIFRLSCMKVDFAFYAAQPTIKEMQTALGELLKLETGNTP